MGVLKTLASLDECELLKVNISELLSSLENEEDID